MGWCSKWHLTMMKRVGEIVVARPSTRLMVWVKMRAMTKEKPKTRCVMRETSMAMLLVTTSKMEWTSGGIVSFLSKSTQEMETGGKSHIISRERAKTPIRFKARPEVSFEESFIGPEVGGAHLVSDKH